MQIAQPVLYTEVQSRTQGSRPRPRTQKNPRPRPRTAFPRTDTLEAKDRNARGQGPWTHAQVLSKKKKKGLQKFFSGDLQKKKGLHKNLSSDLHKKTFSKKFFKRSTNFEQFKKYCCPRAEDRAIFEDLRPRGQGQGLQNLSSRTPPLAIYLTFVSVALVHINIQPLPSLTVSIRSNRDYLV